MKVLMYGWEYPPHITGGLGTACYGITKSLAKQSVNILFVVPKVFGNEDNTFATIQDAGGIPSKYIEADSGEFWKNIQYSEISANIYPYTNPEDYSKEVEKKVLMSQNSNENLNFTPFSGNYGKDLWAEVKRYSMATSLLAMKENYDIIHAHDWLTFPAAISTKQLSNKPLVVHIHATEFDRNGGNINKEIFEIEKRGMEVSDKVITVSNFTKSIVIGKYGIQPQKVVTIHNGINISSGAEHLNTKNRKNEKVVTFLGRITYQKGPEYFLEAASRVLKKQSNIHFVMAGSGDLKDKMERHANKLGISSNVTFPGFLNEKEIKKLFSRTDLFVMPSVSEPFGITPLEAMLSNVPVIISKQSGVSEVIKNAVKVDYWDINALSDAIWGILNYNTLSDSLSTKGSIEVNKLRWDKTGRKILEVYNSLI